jgi:putative transposase
VRSLDLKEHPTGSGAVYKGMVDDYNTVRPHSSIGSLAHTEFPDRHRQGHVSDKTKLSAA